MPGESVPQGLWLPPRVCTLYVAASDALDRSRAQCDYLCSGASDQDEINAALAALPAGVQGKVVLSEGTFTIDGPITIPANNIMLEGMGNSTFIDGDGLATTEHAIVISGVTGCTVKNLRIQTQDGGGKVCHCIFIEDGANDTHIEKVTIEDSDSDGIHIEGTTIYDISIHDVTISDADDYGIYADMDAANFLYRSHISHCLIIGTGNSGIFFGNTGNIYYGEIGNNIVFGAGGHGIHCGGTRVSIVGNFCYENNLHGINVGNPECQVNSNYCYDNSQGAAGVSHGINIGGDADKCQINNNYINDPGDRTEDGIHLADGAIDCLIAGNYCYNCMGSGIALTANNLDCLIKGNYCELNDDYGIEITAATCSKNIVEGNKLKGNVTGNLLDSGVLTTVEESNKEITPPEIKRYVYMKNTSGGPLVAGDVVIFKSAVVAGDEFTTTVTLGDDHVLGMVAEAIANTAYGYVLVAGKTTVLKGSNDNGAIVIGDFLCASDTAVEAVKAGALDTAFAISLADLAAAGPTALDALLINPLTF